MYRIIICIIIILIKNQLYIYYLSSLINKILCKRARAALRLTPTAHIDISLLGPGLNTCRVFSKSVAQKPNDNGLYKIYI